MTTERSFQRTDVDLQAKWAVTASRVEQHRVAVRATVRATLPAAVVLRGQFGKAYEEIEVRADLVTLRLGAHLEVALVGSSRAGVTGSRSWNHPRCAPNWPAPAPPS